jgi:predicted dienelactone hydrolase
MPALARHILRFVTFTFAGIAAAIALLVATMFAEHFRSTELPPPTGAYNVGRTSYFFTDGADSPASNDQQPRELVVWIWYPAQVQSTSKSADYFPAAWLKAANDSWAWIMTHIILRDLSKVRVHSVLDAPIAPDEGSYPVVVMRPGGSALTLQYTTLAEDLASHGYVVVGFDAPYRTQLVVLPNGEIKHRPLRNDPEEVPLERVNQLMMMWTEDVRFVLDRLEALNELDDRGLLTHRLDLSRVGVFGHSFGGATALQVCHDDSRCKAGIDIDGMPFGSVVVEGVKQPFMFLMGDHSHDLGSAPEGLRVARDLNGIYRRLPEADRVALMIEGADHFSFADGGVIRSHAMLSILRAVGLVIDGRRQLATTSACVSAFFGRYLNNEVGGFDRCTRLEGVKPAELVIEGK